MEIDTKKEAKLKELKKQLDGLAGKELDLSTEQLVQFIFPVASQSYDDTGAVTYQRIIFPGKSCQQMRLLDVAGSSSTGDDGKRVFLLSSFLCSNLNSFAAPVNLVATPRSASPCYTTTTLRLVPTPNVPNAFSDVEVTVFAWKPNGSPAPGISIDWRCRLVSFQIIL
jgi:hypothetical protein